MNVRHFHSLFSRRFSPLWPLMCRICSTGYAVVAIPAAAPFRQSKLVETA